MKYNKGQKFFIKHKRKGNFFCEAEEDFDTEECEFYPLKDLYDGERFPCRNTLCELIPIEDDNPVLLEVAECHL